MKNIFLFFWLLIALDSSAQSPQKNSKQPVLGYRTASILTVAGLQFKDLNRNGKLDKYEDWRLPDEVRSRDLLSKMTVEEKVGFMLISTASMKDERNGSSELNEEDRVSTTNMFTRKPLPTPMMNVAGSTKEVTKFHFPL